MNYGGNCKVFRLNVLTEVTNKINFRGADPALITDQKIIYI